MPARAKLKTNRSLKLQVLWERRYAGVSWPSAQGHTEPAGWSSCPGPPGPPPSCLDVSGLPTGEKTHIFTHIPHPIASLSQHRWKQNYSLQTWGLENSTCSFSSYERSNSIDSTLSSQSLPPFIIGGLSADIRSRGCVPPGLLFSMILGLFPF